MNKFKICTMKLSVLAFFAAVFCASFFCMGCSEDNGNFVGTSEEPNEIIAEAISSSEVLSSSSSLAKSSSSEKNNLVQYSSAKKPSEGIKSSSSGITNTQPQPESSSSQDGDSRTPIQNETDNSLGYYLHLFELDNGRFDDNVLATTAVGISDRDGNSNEPSNPPRGDVTEFDVLETPHRFVKQNVAALSKLFPNAYERYSVLATAIANGSADEGCGLYMLNIRGMNYAGHILAEITSHKITVLDVKADGCKQKNDELIRFLFKFCGEIDSYPEIERIVVDGNLSGNGCSALNENGEWVKK